MPKELQTLVSEDVDDCLWLYPTMKSLALPMAAPVLCRNVSVYRRVSTTRAMSDLTRPLWRTRLALFCPFLSMAVASLCPRRGCSMSAGCSSTTAARGRCMRDGTRAHRQSTAMASFTKMGRRTYALPNAPGGARFTWPRVYVRWLPGALVPAAPCAHAAARSARPFAGTSKLRGAFEVTTGRVCVCRTMRRR